MLQFFIVTLVIHIKHFYCFFLPDLGFIGYLGGKAFGALTHNITHSYIVPLSLAVIIWYLDLTIYKHILIIWVSHIGFDRALGYGLKYSRGFRYTHLGNIGI